MDVTDRSTVPSEPWRPPSRYVTFKGVASGARNRSVNLYYRDPVQAHGDLGRQITDIVSVTDDSLTGSISCLPPGQWEIVAVAVCPDGNGVYAFLPFEMPNLSPDVQIANIEHLYGGNYFIDTRYRLQPGQAALTPQWDVYPRLAGGGFGLPQHSNTSTVTGAPGDKIVATLEVCGGSTGSTEAILPAPPSVEVAVVSGDGQRAVLRERAEQPLKVKFTASDPSFTLATLTAVFQVLSVPPSAVGYGVGADEMTVSSSYSVPVAADGTASAVMVAGDLPGAYVVRVQSPLSLTGSQAIFTITGVKPAAVGIVKDTLNVADLAPAYAVSATEPTIFYSIGLDAAGQKVGPMKANWSASASGNPSTRGAGSLLPVAAKSTTFSPTRAGKLKLAAGTSLKGVSNGSSDLFITALYVSVQNTFDPAAPSDDAGRFVPGMYLDGTDVALNVMETTGQFISLHLITGGAKGKATFTVDSTNYLGLAMNYPLNGDLTEDMQFTNGQQSITVNFNTASGDTWTPLLIRDFGASGTIRVSVQSGKSTYALKPLKLPIDADGNGLPDAGWMLSTNGAVTSAGQQSADDVDEPISGTSTGIGDGLSSFEEYRGFLVGGKHVRTDPRRKDVFLDVDPEILVEMNALHVFTALPLRFWYVDPTEALGDSISNRFERSRPVINPNRAGVPGSRAAGKRAVRIVYQLNHPPVLRDPLTSRTYEAWAIGILGITIPDEFNDLYTLNASSNAEAIHSPDHVQAVELYPRGFNRAIHTDFADTYRDVNRRIVPDCATVAAGTPCDYHDEANGLILPYVESAPGLGTLYFQLHTVLDPNRYPFPDWYTKPDSTTCIGGTVDETTHGLSDEQMMMLRAAYSGHELGHALHMEHTPQCGNIMYDNEPAFPRRTMADVVPIFGVFAGPNLNQIILTEP